MLEHNQYQGAPEIYFIFHSLFCAYTAFISHKEEHLASIKILSGHTIFCYLRRYRRAGRSKFEC